MNNPETQWGPAGSGKSGICLPPDILKKLKEENVININNEIQLIKKYIRNLNMLYDL
jgi:hypothetical protein